MLIHEWYYEFHGPNLAEASFGNILAESFKGVQRERERVLPVIQRITIVVCLSRSHQQRDSRVPESPLFGRWFLASIYNTAGGSPLRRLRMAVETLSMDHNSGNLGDCNRHYLVTDLWG